MNKPLKIFPAAADSQNPPRNAPHIGRGTKRAPGDYGEGALAE